LLRREGAIDRKFDGLASDAGDARGDAVSIDQEASELAGMYSCGRRELGDYTRTIDARMVRCFVAEDAGFEKPSGPRAQHHDGEEQKPEGASRTAVGV
jgi:hypothetical protein